jgi:hypothetical protein
LRSSVVLGAEPTSCILFEQNLFERFGEESDWAKQIDSAGILFQVAGRDITLRHNTGWANYTLLSMTNECTDNFVFTENLVTPGSYALHPDGAGGEWNGALAKHIRGQSFMEGNTIIREGSERARQTSPKDCPPGRLWFRQFFERRAWIRRRISCGPGAKSGAAPPTAAIQARTWKR